MSYSKCGLCLQDLEVIKLASGIPYLRCLNWRGCFFFCREDNVYGYRKVSMTMSYLHIKYAKVEKKLCCKHMEVSTLRVLRPEKNLSDHTSCADKRKSARTINELMNCLQMSLVLQCTNQEKLQRTWSLKIKTRSKDLHFRDNLVE